MLFLPIKDFFLCGDDYTSVFLCLASQGTRFTASFWCKALSDCFDALLFLHLPRLFPRFSPCLLVLFSLPSLSFGTSAVCFPSLLPSDSSKCPVLASFFRQYAIQFQVEGLNQSFGDLALYPSVSSSVVR